MLCNFDRETVREREQIERGKDESLREREGGGGGGAGKSTCCFDQRVQRKGC